MAMFEVRFIAQNIATLMRMDIYIFFFECLFSLLEELSDFFSPNTLLSDRCSHQDDSRVYVVSGAGGVGSPCNGEYRRQGELNEKPLMLGSTFWKTGAPGWTIFFIYGYNSIYIYR